MAKKIKEINPQEYGIVREPSEDQLYLMKRCRNRLGWAEEVAVKLEGGWSLAKNRSKYMVLVDDVTWATEENQSQLLKILEEAA